MPSRLERSPFAQWWWTVDRFLLFSLLVLMVLGIVLCMAGSPPVAERLGLPTFHFVSNQVKYMVPALAVMFGISMMSPRHVRRTALIIYVIAMALVVCTLLFGVEVKGAKRWINFPGGAIQPSEFVKPAFVVLAAWAFSEGGRRKDVPGTVVGFMLLACTIVPLVLQPDIGQTMLITLVWCGLVFLSGLHLFWVAGLGGVSMFGLFIAYHVLPHVAARINRFLDPASGDTFQVDNAIDSFVQGGWLGKGPGEGTVKRILPDSHTDFIFAVTAEEFGILVCIGLLTIFAMVVLRGLVLSRRNEEPFCRLAAAGLVMLFGLQSVINMAVNVHLMPAKGMTLPFISYGGSSLISLALAMGFLLAVTRRRPRAEIYDRIVPEHTEEAYA
ncbi:putative lipid II flippase FtsW [Alsobacter soli]|uniref:Probable peptidoglycan glycosyltransferase FtsW n=1 Tax=Alsobacter soli TaxID=2109933 RepID=A0A2T1HTY1_9HYPH|nr:putative lipid II flippase FtsW [Alsobacter soli]PSC05090.1 putative lipid II flippase FtsW [Alsobacter soli]